MSLPRFWNFRVFTDHLGYREYANILKSVVRRHPFIFLSLEANSNGMRYRRPYRLASFCISHKRLDKTKTLYYPICVEDELSKDFSIHYSAERSSRVLFLSSNWKKIDYVSNLLGQDFQSVDFYSIFGRPVPSKSGEWYKDALVLASQYRAAIVCDNSQEDGYIQGSFLFAAKVKTVPIFQGSEVVRRKVLRPEAYINLQDYASMSETNRARAIDKVFNHYDSGGKFYTGLMEEVVDFFRQADYRDFERVIERSQFYRDKIFP